MNRTFAWVLVALLVLSVAFNITNYYRLADLEQRIGNVSSRLMSLDQLQSTVNAIGSALDKMQREAAWYSIDQTDVSTTQDCGEGLVSLGWTFRELAPGSSVGLSYRVSDAQWQEAEITQVGPTSFTAQLAVPIDPEDTLWGFGYSRVLSSNSAESNETSPAGTRLDLQYTIHVTEADGRQKSGEVEYLDLGKLNNRFEANVMEQTRGREFEASLYQELSCREAQSVEFILEDASGQRHSIELERAEETAAKEKWSGTLTFDEPVEASGFVFRVTFAGGEVVEREFRLP